MDIVVDIGQSSPCGVSIAPAVQGGQREKEGDWCEAVADETKLLVSLYIPYRLSGPVPATSDGGETCNVGFHRANSSTSVCFAKPEDTTLLSDRDGDERE
jgi:hypothetical protein